MARSEKIEDERSNRGQMEKTELADNAGRDVKEL